MKLQELKIYSEKNNIRLFKKFSSDVGKYDYICINVALSENINNMIKEYCHINELIGVKGHLDIINNELIVEAEAISFLTSKGVK